MSVADTAIQYARDHREAFVKDLEALLRIPSVSSNPEHKKDMEAAANWLCEKLAALGFDQTAVLPTAGHPVVYGEYLKAGPQAPTILFYGHYDVQPPDPLDLWTSPPFEPTVRGENLYARGASDMKGQVVCHIKAVESIIRSSNGNLPINLKYMLEGEEEVGSPSLGPFITEHKEKLRCDMCLNGDSGILTPETPAIMYSLRGMAYFELRLKGPAQDLHSGSFGGAVHNPANVLAKLIGAMHDDQGRIAIPGFYDRVRPISAAERADTARLPIGDEWWKQQTGVPELFGEAGYNSNERTGARPTLDVNGILSGFTGEGAKTVLPSKSMAKISMRLVPDQEPKEIKACLERFLEKNMPPSVTYELIDLCGCRASIVERDSKGMLAAQQALREVWQKEPLFIRQGGSVPVVGQIQDILEVEALPLGFELPDDNLHAPDEKIHLGTFWKGMEAFIRFMTIIPGLHKS